MSARSMFPWAIAGVLAIAMPVVASYEGLRLAAYYDPVGIPTICYGSTDGVTLGMVRSRVECERLLQTELAGAVETVDRLVAVSLPDTRRAALASFVYNVGERAFLHSTLLKKLNAGDVTGACDQLRRWVYAKGKRLPGLVKRREAERELCLR